MSGDRTLKILRKGGKRATIPLAPRTSRVLDLYLNERTTGPIFLGAKGGRMDRYAADRYRHPVSPEPIGATQREAPDRKDDLPATELLGRFNHDLEPSVTQVGYVDQLPTKSAVGSMGAST